MSNSEAGTSNEQYKSSSSKKRNVSNYNKRHILNLLKEKNCHPKQLESMLARFRVDDENIIKEFVDKQAELSQDRLEQMLRSQHNKHFLNLDECARDLTENGESITDNTLPVTLEALSKSEKHPPSADVNGIDLKLLYRMLANMTAGYPVDELKEGPTKEFLKQCYNELMDDVLEMDAKSLKNLLIEQDKQTQPVYSWLCNTDYSQYLTKLFKEPINENENENEDYIE